MNGGPPPDDLELFSAIAGGDEAAFAVLFRRFTPRLLPFITRMTRNEHLAQEMIQETFLRLWVGRVELMQVEQPSAWIYRIASNVSLTWLRTQSNRQRILEEVEMEANADSLSHLMDARELDGIIRRAVNLLPERQRQVYLLSREEGLKHREIAAALGTSPETVKKQVGAALKAIQEAINRDTGLSLLTILLLWRI